MSPRFVAWAHSRWYKQRAHSLDTHTRLRLRDCVCVDEHGLVGQALSLAPEYGLPGLPPFTCCVVSIICEQWSTVTSLTPFLRS